MRAILSLFFAVAFSAAGLAAGANVGTLGAQFGQPQGFSEGSGVAQCPGYVAPAGTPAAAPLPYQQCAVVVGQVHGVAGTFTIKRPNIEVLLSLVCGATDAGQLIWRGETFGPTLAISVMDLPAGFVSPCWVEWQEINNAGSVSATGGDFEYQLTIYGG